MARQILIRFKVDQEFEKSRSCLEQVLRVQTIMHAATFGGEPIGPSYLFSTLGVDGAIYESPVPDYADQRLVGFDLVIDVGLYGKPVGRMYDELDALALIAEFIGSIVSAHLAWDFYICTEDSQIIQ